MRGILFPYKPILGSWAALVALLLAVATKSQAVCWAGELPQTAVAATQPAGPSEPIARLEESGGNLVRFSGDGTLILTVGEDDARVWDARTFEPVTAPLPYPGHYVTAGFAADGKAIFVADDTGLREWVPRTGKSIGAVIKTERKVRSAAVSPDGKKVAFTWAMDEATAEPVVVIYDTTAGKRLLSISDRHAPRFNAFSPDGTRLLSVGYVNRDTRVFVVRDVATGQEIFPPVETVSDDNCTVGSDCAPAAFSPDGKTIAITAGSWYVVLDAQSGKRVAGKPPEDLVGVGSEPYFAWLKYVSRGSQIVVVQRSRAVLSDAATTRVFFEDVRVDLANEGYATNGTLLVCKYWTAPGNVPIHYAVGVWNLKTGKALGRLCDVDAGGFSDLSAEGRYVAVSGSREHPDDTLIWDLGPRESPK
jgi:hypothetical protein